MMPNADLDRGQWAIALLADIVKVWDQEFPPSERYYASLGVTILLAALEKLVFRAREEVGCGGNDDLG
jgi:hypothetical protein